MKRIAWVLAVGVLFTAQPAWAARTRVHEAAESPRYGTKAGGMLGRGALNVVTSFVDVIVNIVNETKAGPPFVGTLTGVAKGTGCGVLRLGSGAVDLVTFWVPGFNGFPVSDSYENCFATGRTSSASYTQPSLTTQEPSISSNWETPEAAPAAPTESNLSSPITPIPPTAGDSATIAVVKELSRNKYGRPRKEIEDEIFARLKEASGNVTSANPAESDMKVK